MRSLLKQIRSGHGISHKELPSISKSRRRSGEDSSREFTTCEVRHVHSLRGFHLRNCLTNSKEVLARVGESNAIAEKSLQLDKSRREAKREALRVVMSPFDSAGLLCFIPKPRKNVDLGAIEIKS